MTIRLVAAVVPLVIMGWFATLMSVSLFSDAAPAQVVIFPSAKLLDKLPSEIAIVEMSAVSITFVSAQPRLARKLYANGALMVLPSGLQGCSPKI